MFIQELTVKLIFPDNASRTLHIEKTVKRSNEEAYASIIKDAGSDPDITNGIRIICSLRNFKSSDTKDLRDYILKFDNCRLIIRGNEGVGTVTRDGLASPKGKWAINPVPLKMISDNLSAAGFGRSNLTANKTFILEIYMKNGEELSKKTLNPILGVEGGLSILGTTGIVVPYSHEAYVETIKILVKGLDRNNICHVVFTTGAQSLKAAQKIYPELTAESFIRIADYIADSLKIVKETGIKKISVACMPGKLFKYACAFENTNAKYTAVDTYMILSIADQNSFSFTADEISVIKHAVTIREVINYLSQKRKRQVIELWKKLALSFFHQILNNSNIDIEILVFDYIKH